MRNQIVGHLAHILDHVLRLNGALFQRAEAGRTPRGALLSAALIKNKYNISKILAKESFSF